MVLTCIWTISFCTETLFEYGYVEVLPVFQEKIDDNILSGVSVTGVLNAPVADGAVNLTTAGLNILQAHSGNVRELLNYSRKSAASITSATYSAGTITVNYTYGGSNVIHITVNDVSANHVLSNGTYEGKAQNIENNLSANPYGIILAGSSSIENWTSSATDLAPATTYNVGIGGTRIADWADNLAERLIYPYNPRAVVLYVGINDIKYVAENGGNLNTIASSAASEMTDLLYEIHERLPDATVYYVLINQIPLAYSNGQGNNYVSQINDFNSRVSTYAVGKSWLKIIDADVDMVNQNGTAISSYFTDGIHMTSAGYTLWVNRVKGTVLSVDYALYH